MWNVMHVYMVNVLLISTVVWKYIFENKFMKSSHFGNNLIEGVLPFFEPLFFNLT